MRAPCGPRNPKTCGAPVVPYNIMTVRALYKHEETNNIYVCHDVAGRPLVVHRRRQLHHRTLSCADPLGRHRQHRHRFLQRAHGNPVLLGLQPFGRRAALPKRAPRQRGGNRLPGKRRRPIPRTIVWLCRLWHRGAQQG